MHKSTVQVARPLHVEVAEEEAEAEEEAILNWKLQSQRPRHCKEM